MKKYLEYIIINILELLAKKWIIFHKAAKVLKRDGLEKFFLRIKLYFINMFLRKNYDLRNNVNLPEEISKFKSRNYSRITVKQELPTAAFTIVSKNYMQYALTLRESYLEHNPKSEFYIILMDMFRNTKEVELFQDLVDQGVKILCLHEVRNGIGDLNVEAMLFKYDILEMNTAIKPFFMEYFCNIGYENVVYIDPDIYFFGSLQPLVDKLQTNDIILTPHALKPFGDELNPSDLDILRAGSYNLGFVAIRNTPNAIRLCRWWQEKLFDLCINDLGQGLFVDQKWMDLTPSLFEKVYIERNPAYNVAYWNLHERKLEHKAEGWFVNDEALVFFHYSGMPIDNIECISKHQNRHRLAQLPEIKPLFEFYRDEVLKNGYHVFRGLCGEYYFGYLPGTDIKIPDIIRRKWYKDILQNVVNPYMSSLQSVNDMIKEINKEDGGVSRIESAIYDARSDLKSFFGSIDKAENKAAFLNWFKQSAEREYKLSSCFIEKNVPLIDMNSPESSKNKVGINLIGYFENVIGTAEIGRLTVKKLYSTGIPWSIFPVYSDIHAKLSAEESAQFRKYYIEDPFFQKNIFFINADGIKSMEQYYPHVFKGHYNMAVWWWEFDDYFGFEDAFSCVDEVLVMTDFIKTAIEKVAPPKVKVRKITYPLVEDWDISLDKASVREKYNIAADSYAFYFNFDYLSSFERKNPVDLLTAFAQFAEAKNDVCLVLKTIHSQSDSANVKFINELLEKLQIRDKVVLIDRSLAKNELMSVVNACDCYVSLHRSEGLGLGMMEAMYLGKPVIGTAFGGNLDFMDQENSLLLQYELAELKNDFGPYKKGWLWASPDIDQAVVYMERVYSDRIFAEKLGKNAAKSIRERYSLSKFQHDIMDIIKD